MSLHTLIYCCSTMASGGDALLRKSLKHITKGWIVQRLNFKREWVRLSSTVLHYKYESNVGSQNISTQYNQLRQPTLGGATSMMGMVLCFRFFFFPILCRAR